MQAKTTFKHAIAAAAFLALSPLTAHAVAFTAPAEATFSLSDSLIGLQTGSTPIEVGVSGSGSVIQNATGQVTAVILPLTSLDVTGTDLSSFAGVGSGLTLTAGTASASLSDFAYSAATRELNFTVDFGAGSPLSGAFVATSQATTVPFVDGAAPTGSFLASSLKLTSATASTIVSGLGLPAFYSGILASVDFGNVEVNVSAVPEPSTYALIGLGLAGAAVAARRRRQAI